MRERARPSRRTVVLSGVIGPDTSGRCNVAAGAGPLTAVAIRVLRLPLTGAAVLPQAGRAANL